MGETNGVESSSCSQPAALPNFCRPSTGPDVFSHTLCSPAVEFFATPHFKAAAQKEVDAHLMWSPTSSARLRLMATFSRM